MDLKKFIFSSPTSLFMYFYYLLPLPKPSIFPCLFYIRSRIINLHKQSSALHFSALINVHSIPFCQISGEEGGRSEWIGFLLEYIRYMANLLVSTCNADERARLQEQFSMQGNCFEVRREGVATLEAILRAISFEYFQNTPPPLAQKITAFAENAITGHCSLSIFREVVARIKNLEDLLAMHQAYFRSIGAEVGDRESGCEEVGFSEDYSVGEENDRLFELVERGEMRFTRTIDSTDFHQAYEISVKQHCPAAVSEKTQLPSSHGHNPEEPPPRETLEDSCRQSHIFYTAEAYYGHDWWKQQRTDSSKEMSRFDCKASNPFNQKSIGKLVIEEFKYDLNREIELGKQINRHEDVEAFKYRKMMKDKLLSAKLKKKKKK